MAEPKSLGSLVLVLHAHLPYVLSHGRWPHGTDWLNEAAAETYLPLLNMLYELVDEGYSPKITIGLTPVLVEQLAHPVFKQAFPDYLRMKQTLAGQDEKEFSRSGRGRLAPLAEGWSAFYGSVLEDFLEHYDSNIVGAFGKLQDQGHIEIMTSAATHAYLPLLGGDTNVQAQIKLGIANYQKHFGRPPRGMWLPECGYRPRYEWQPPVGAKTGARLRKGIEEFLSENGLGYFIVDSHLLAGGEALGVYMERFEALKALWQQSRKAQPTPYPKKEKSPYQPYLLQPPGGGKPVAIFVRDSETAFQVWSGAYGYPGGYCYLDFHKRNFPGGLRYWRITDNNHDLGSKLEYQPHRIEERLEENASHFSVLVEKLLRGYREKYADPAVVCAPFDAELFGHWWFEGTRWLKKVILKICEHPHVKLETASEYLQSQPPVELVRLPEGSWGEGGFHWIWLNQWTEWTWKHIYQDEAKFTRILDRFDEQPGGQDHRVLKQLARELLLLEASDWQFLISTWSARDYAESRFRLHHQDFNRLAGLAEKMLAGAKPTPEELAFLSECEERDQLFADLDINWWRNPEKPI